MTYIKLKENHPFHQKVQELEHIMDEMDVYISVGVNNQLFITDLETNETYAYLDTELSVGSYGTTSEFPCGLETKLVKEKND